MGSLKPGASYVYERDGGVTYAREFGSDPSTRVAIGWDYDPRTIDGKPSLNHLEDIKLWNNIRQEASINPALQKALNRVIMIYKLSKDKI
jgi:hypothetical protein